LTQFDSLLLSYTFIDGSADTERRVSYTARLLISLVSKSVNFLLLLQALEAGHQRTGQLTFVCARLCVPTHWLFSFSFQMIIATGHWKVHTDTMKAYRKQYNYHLHRHQCQLGHVTPGNALLISMCILMLPMVQLSAEHAQLVTKYHINLINQWYVHQHHLNISHTPLVLPSLSDVLPTIVLQNDVVRLNVICPSYTSSRSSIRHSLHLNLLSGLWKNVVAVVLALLLLLSGDIETNPGPLGEFLYAVFTSPSPFCKGTPN